MSVPSIIAASGLAALSPSIAQAAPVVVESLAYDGTSVFGVQAQDYEPGFSSYDIFAIEDFSLAHDTAMHSFESLGFLQSGGNISNAPVLVEIAQSPAGAAVASTGVGGFSSDTGLLSAAFAGEVLAAGDYFVRWRVIADYNLYGNIRFFAQNGEHDAADGVEGAPTNALSWNPGGGFGKGTNPYAARDSHGGPLGVNFVLWGEPLVTPVPLPHAGLMAMAGCMTLGVRRSRPRS